MSDYDRCKTCGEYAWLSRHRCPPVWLCQVEGEDGDDFTEVRARSAESAAERFAERYDSDGEYSIIRCEGDGYVIVVKQPDNTTGEEAQRFTIEAESVPTYRAYAIPA